MGQTIRDEDDIDVDHRPRNKPQNEAKKLCREIFWPRDLLPTHFPRARILTWGYDVRIESLVSKTSKSSIFQHAQTLLSDLTLLRSSSSDKAKPLVFIAHSLGGIVVKDALSISKMEITHFNEVLPATLGVVFLGTPHHGSKTASLGKIALELTRLFLQNPNTKILRALEIDSEILERISRSFGQILASGKIKVHSFQEELDTKGTMIVGPVSSTIGYLNETRSFLHANHRNMAKFQSGDDVNFLRVISVLRRWIDEIDQSQPISNDFSRAVPNYPELSDGLIFDNQYHECLKLLDFDEANTRFENVAPAHGDTYDWVFSPEVDLGPWLEGKITDPIYFIRGKPGSGKSTLMKHVMTNPSTSALLHNYNDNPWICARHFFHDRGANVQKSIEGFLRRIIYQILEQRPELFTLVYPIFSENNRLVSSESLSNIREPGKASCPWQISPLRAALLSIISRSTSTINCCLFVDALDEHDGQHRDLVNLLVELAKVPEKNPLFRLRLCVAGRPENIFMSAFRRYPGFAIQDHTTADIRKYAEDNIRQWYPSDFDEESEENWLSLVKEIVNKANGVFLWVKLAIHEMIEGLENGDDLDELMALLGEIPQELEDVYTRAIRRSRRSSAQALAKHRYEAYVMFQLAASSRSIPLDHFLKAAKFGATGNLTNPDRRGYGPGSSIERRLNSKSAGLLEIYITRDKQEIVQFIHQTAKEFIISGKGQMLITENLDNKHLESGNLLYLRYLLTEICSNRYSDDIYSFDDELDCMLIACGAVAYEVEVREGPVGRYFEAATQSDLTLFRRVLVCWEISRYGRSEWYDRDALIQNNRTALTLLTYVMLDLRTSFGLYLECHRGEIDHEVSALLLDAAINESLYEDPRTDMFKVLIEAGIGADLPQESFDEINQTVKSCEAKRMSEAFRGGLNLWAQLRQRREEGAPAAQAAIDETTA